MAKIAVGIYDEHKLAAIGLKHVIENISDVQVVSVSCEKTSLEKELKNTPVNVLLINIHGMSSMIYSCFHLVKWKYPRTKILAMSALNNEDIILGVIKAGANGFLSKEVGREELVEAIYTLRSGHEYFSNTITHLLLQRYIRNIDGQPNTNQSMDLSSLSIRQIEILRLWGESYSNQEIADQLFISIRTVESHKNHIMQKLNLKTTVDMIKFAIRNNLIDI